MERLTFEGNFCDIAMCRENPCPYNGSCSQKETWERLKAYEDTGLTPEEIKELLHDTTGPLHKKLGAWIDAEAEGRLVVLPCKIGVTLYVPEIWQNIISPFDVYVCGIYDDEILYGDEFDCWYKAGDIGKTVFLTREEAEAALKGEGNG